MTHIANNLLSQVSSFVADTMGLNFPAERWRDLERGIVAVCNDFDHDDLETCIRWLTSTPLSKRQIETLASYLTVGETFFFRDKGCWEALEKEIVPKLVAARRSGGRRIRIWSAACATGEEAYSMAILVKKLVPDLKEWNITILATDINPLFLKKAAEGVYTEWSFRGTPDWLKDAYFRKKDGRTFELLPEIRKMVDFSYHNLAEDSYPSLLNNTNAMDIILCRNVLMYFTGERAVRVVKNLYRSLAEQGWLIVGTTEQALDVFKQFERVKSGDIFLYRKLERQIREKEFQMPVALEIQGMEEVPVSQPPQPILGNERVEGRLIEEEKPIDDLIRLSRAFANRGELSDALKLCDMAIQKDRIRPELHYLRAVILAELGEDQEAERSYSRSIYIHPDFVVAHFALGNLYRAEGRVEESKRHFKNVLELLQRYSHEDVLPESDGLTAGRLAEMIRTAELVGA